MGTSVPSRGASVPGWFSVQQASGDGLMSRMLSGIGLGGSDEPTVTTAPPMASYPGPEEVANARANESSYGSGNESYTEGRIANVLSAKDTKDEGGNVTRRPVGIDDMRWVKSKNAIVTNPDAGGVVPGTPETSERYEQAQLAINRSPIAAVGYDPRHINLDVKSPKDMNIVGLYAPGDDQVWANANYPSVLVHESIHRGLEKLRQAKDDDGKPVVPKELWDKSGVSDDEESVVRYVMARHMGDPEKGSGPVADKQRAEALYRYAAKKDSPTEDERGANTYSKGRVQALEEINKIAAKYLLSQKPGGPR